jgi:hypothetical protein
MEQGTKYPNAVPRIFDELYGLQQVELLSATLFCPNIISRYEREESII